MKKHLSLLLLLLLAGTTTVLAQSRPAQSRSVQSQVWTGFGVRAGGTASMLRGDDVGITDNTTDRSLGLAIGVYKHLPLGNGFALQPELMYIQKGGELSFEDVIDEEGAPTEFDLTYNLNYVELPVMVTYAIDTQSRYVPMLMAGPYVSLATHRNATIDFDGGDFSVDGDEFFSRFDYGAVFGADLGVKLKKRLATIGVRYDLGIADIAKEEAAIDGGVTFENEARNDEWSILVGFRL